MSALLSFSFRSLQASDFSHPVMSNLGERGSTLNSGAYNSFQLQLGSQVTQQSLKKKQTKKHRSSLSPFIFPFVFQVSSSLSSNNSPLQFTFSTPNNYLDSCFPKETEATINCSSLHLQMSL